MSLEVLSIIKGTADDVNSAQSGPNEFTLTMMNRYEVPIANNCAIIYGNQTSLKVIVSLRLDFIYEPNGSSVTSSNLLIGHVAIGSDLEQILTPVGAIPNYTYSYFKSFELDPSEGFEIFVYPGSGVVNGIPVYNAVSGVIQSVVAVNPLPLDFSYLAIDSNGSGEVATKNTGGDWSTIAYLSSSLSHQSNGNVRPWIDVAYGNGRFVAINNADRMVAVSLNNGKNWIAGYLPFNFSVTNIFCILYGEGVFVVCSYNGLNNIATSSDGLNWKYSSIQSPNALGCSGISGGCYGKDENGNGHFAWACQSGHILSYHYASNQLTANYVFNEPIGFIDITYGNGVFFAIENGSFSNNLFGGAMGSIAIRSSDLLSWQVNYLPNYNGWASIVYTSSHNKYYAVSYGVNGIVAEFNPDTSLHWQVSNSSGAGYKLITDNSSVNGIRVSEGFEKTTLNGYWSPYTTLPYYFLASTGISSTSQGGGTGPFSINITATNGTVTKSNPGPYYTGDVVLITATPDAGYRFGSWTGDITGTVNPYNFIVTGDVNATANFVVQSVNAVGLVRNLHTTDIDSEELLEIPIEVSVVDASQNVVDIAVDITAEMYSGNGILLGTKTLTSVNGVATFTDLTIQGAGYNTILFTSPGLNPILSAAILVNNAPVVTQTLVLDTQPFGAISGQPLTQQPATKVVDINGDLILGSVNVVTVSLLSGNAVLSGTTSVTSVDGYAAFTDLMLTGPTGPVTLQFSSPGFNTVISQSFQLTNNGNNLPLSGNFPIRPKSSKTPNKAPTSSDLVAYELAVNLTDQKIYMRDDKNTVYLVGDVSSGSSTPPLDGLSNVTITNKAANDLLRWNGTAWVNVTPASVFGSGTKDTLPKWGTSGLVDSSVTDSGTYITSTNASVGRWANNTYAQFAHSKVFSSTASTDYALLQSDAGVTFLNSTGVLHFRQSNGEVAAFNQGNFLVGYADGDTTTYKVDIKGTLHATGDTTLDKLAGTGNRMVVANASGTLATDAIPDGTVTSIALTSDSKELTITGSPVTDSGTIDLALSKTGVTAGSYTNTDLTVDASGRITSAKSGSVADLTAGKGISVTGTYPSFTITNSAPDQEVTLKAGTGMSVTGTYPGFTLATTITQYTDSDARKSLSAGTGISYDSNTGVISNSAPDQTVKLTAGTGIKTSGTYPDFTITNDAPDQTVTLSAGSGIGVTGTYPSFTVSSTITQYTDSDARKSLSAGTGISYNSGTGVITNASPDQTVTLTAGTGIGVSGTYPSFTVTNNSPDQTVSLTAGSGINITGTYPSFTITSTAGNGSVTSVDMTVPTGLKISGAPITGSGTLALTLDTGYSIPTTSSQSNWDTAYSNRITSLTTTGSSGSATLSSNTLNIPTYTLAGLGGQASSTNLTSLSGLTYTSASFVKMTAAGTFGLDTSTYLTANQSITLSGDVSGSGSTAITVTLATVGATKGGTGQTTYATGDTLYASASNTLSKLSGNTTTTRKFLRQTGNGTASAAPAWDTVTKTDVGLSSVENTALSTWAGSSNITTVGTLGGLTVSGTVNLNALIYPSTDGTAGQVLSTNGLGTLSWATVSGGSPAGSTGDIQYNDGSGNLTASSNFSYGSSAYDQLALYSNNAAFGVLGVFGASGQTYPLLEFRDYLGTTVHSYFDATGNLYLNGQGNIRFADSGSSNYVAMQAPATISTNYTLTLPTTAGSNNQVLKTNGSGTLSWTSAVTSLIGGNSTTLLGSLPYQSNTDTTSLLSPNTSTTRKFLRQVGNGTNGAAPAWDTLTAADVPMTAANSIFLANNFGGL